MKYLEKGPFSVGGSSAAYRDGWERVFGKPEVAPIRRERPSLIHIRCPNCDAHLVRYDPPGPDKCCEFCSATLDPTRWEQLPMGGVAKSRANVLGIPVVLDR